MTPPSLRKVIAIAAPIGGGKSTLTRALAAGLGGAPILYFDDYETATRMPVDQLAQWLADGADFNLLQAPGLAQDLAALRGDKSSAGTDARELVFEMPLGRAWSATAAAIDVLVWVDVPPDIALARRLHELSADMLRRDAEVAKRGLAWLHDYLAHYVSTIHHVLDAQRRTVRPQADLVLDGMEPADALVRRVLAHLGRT